MFKNVLVTDCKWDCKDEEELLGLPDGFSLDVEETQDIDEAILNAAYDKYEYELEDYDYEVIDDDEE